MKLEIDLEQLDSRGVKDKNFSIRIPLDDFKKLKAYNSNVSHTIRVLINEFLNQAEKEKKQWTRK